MRMRPPGPSVLSNRINGKVSSTSIGFDIVGNHTYLRKGSGRWVTGTLTAKDRASAGSAQGTIA
jgi:hypothetical protein